MSEVSTVNQFREKALGNSFEETEVVMLPSGLTCRLRRPKPIWWIVARGTLPQGLALRAEGRELQPLSPEETQVVIPITVRLIEAMFVEPQVKRGAPLEGPELNPNLIGDEDLTFILKYAGGEVAADGSDLSAFRGRTGVDTGGTSGGAVEMPAKSAAGTDGDAGLAD